MIIVKVLELRDGDRSVTSNDDSFSPSLSASFSDLSGLGTSDDFMPISTSPAMIFLSVQMQM